MTEDKKWTDEEKWMLRMDLYATVSEHEYDRDEEEQKRRREEWNNLTPEEQDKRWQPIRDKIRKSFNKTKKKNQDEWRINVKEKWERIMSEKLEEDDDDKKEVLVDSSGVSPERTASNKTAPKSPTVVMADCPPLQGGSDSRSPLKAKVELDGFIMAGSGAPTSTFSEGDSSDEEDADDDDEQLGVGDEAQFTEGDSSDEEDADDDDEQLGVGDEAQFTEEIRQYKGHDIVPQPDWILTEGLSFRVEEVFPGSIVYPRKHYLERNEPRPSPPYTRLSVPRVYESSVDESNFKYMLGYDYINTEGTLIQTDEPPEERVILNTLSDEDIVKIDGIDYMVWTDLEILVPTHWLKRTKTWAEALGE